MVLLLDESDNQIVLFLFIQIFELKHIKYKMLVLYLS
jgi:hypothetical protein